MSWLRCCLFAAQMQVITPASNGGTPCPAETTKQVPCSNPADCPVKPQLIPVNCIGSWGPPTGICNGPCQGQGTQTSTYTITTPAENGGAPCEAANGATKPVPCTNPTPCPVNCVGSWGPPGECKAACASRGTATSTYIITTPAANGGTPCEAAAGQPRETECTNPTPCPVDCVGSWGPPGACDAKCEGSGKQTATYTITTPAANGGRACEASSGQTRDTACTSSIACPKAVEQIPVPPPAPIVAPTPVPVVAPTPAPAPVVPPPVVATPEPVKPAGGDIVTGAAVVG
jgi:hypothetical protein